MFAFIKKIFFHKVLQNSSIYLFASILRMGVPFFLLPILTRFLSPADYGILATYQAFIMIFSVIIGQNVAASVSVNFFHLDKNEFKVYFFNNYLVILGYFLFCLLSVFFFKNLVEAYLDIPGNWMYVVVVISFLDGLSTPMLNVWRAEKKPLPFGAYQVSQTTLNVGLTILLVMCFGMNWQGRLLAILLACAIFTVILLNVIVKGGYATFKLNKAYAKDAFLYGAPLIPHMLSGALIGTIDRMFITAMVGVSATGLYTVGYQIGMIMDLVAASANQAIYPFLFERLKRNDEAGKLEIVKATYLYDSMIIMAGITVSVFAPLVIKYVVGSQFQGAVEFVRWIAIGYTIKGLYYIRVHYLFFEKKTHVLAVCTVIAALMSAICNYFLIKANGAIGAAQANVISFSVWALLTWFMANKVHPMPWLFFLGPRTKVVKL